MDNGQFNDNFIEEKLYHSYFCIKRKKFNKNEGFSVTFFLLHTINVKNMLMPVITVSDTQYGMPAIVFKATLGAYIFMPILRTFLIINDIDAIRLTNLLLNLEHRNIIQ